MQKESIKEPWYGKSTWQLLIAVLLFPVPILALKYYYPRQPKYVTYQTTKGMPEADIVEVFRKSYEKIKGEYVQQVLENNPEKSGEYKGASKYAF